MKKYNFIYKTTNTKNNKFYIGKHSTDNLEDGYMGSGLYIKNSKKKYGSEFNSIFKTEILEKCDDIILLNNKEKEYINNNINNNLCKNISLGGTGGDNFSNNPNKEILRSKYKERKASQETKAKMSKAQSNMSEETKNKISGSLKGIKRSIETKEKIRIANIGKKYNLKLKQKLSNSHKGLKASQETKAKMSKAFSNRRWINKDNTNKFIKSDCLNEYLNLGWRLGMKSDNKI